MMRPTLRVFTSTPLWDDRCGKCVNCKKLARVQRRALACANPPFSHVDDNVIQMWNDALRDFQCLNPPEEDEHGSE